MGQAAAFRDARNGDEYNMQRPFFHQGATQIISVVSNLAVDIFRRLLTGGNLRIPTIHIPIACDIRIGIESNY